MIALDVNVLLYAMRSDCRNTKPCTVGSSLCAQNRQQVALFPPVLMGLTRIATNPRIFVNPSPLGTVTNFARALQTTPGFEVLPKLQRPLRASIPCRRNQERDLLPTVSTVNLEIVIKCED